MPLAGVGLTPNAPTSRRFSTFVVPSAIFLVFMLNYGVRIDGSHGWSDDGSAYLLHARNLLEGKPYGDLGVDATPNHRTNVRYPPILPVLLTPLVRWRGLDFVAFKLTMVFVFSLCLALLPSVFRGRLSFWEIAVLITVIGANPEMFTLVQHINSDGLFLFFLFLFLITMAAGMDSAGGMRRFALLALATVLFALCMMTRSSAVAIVPGLVIYLLVKKDRKLSAWLVVGGMILCAVASSLLWDTRYSESVIFHLSYGSLRRNLIQYPLALGEFFGGGLPAAAVLWGLTLAGATVTWLRQLQLWDCIALPFACLLILWPYSDPFRFALPLIPLILSYSLVGLRGLTARIGNKAGVACGAILFVVIGSSYAATYTRMSAPDGSGGIFSPVSEQLWSYVRNETSEDARIVFTKARTLTLLTRRNGILYAPWVPPNVLWNEICAARPTHIIAAPGIFEKDSLLLVKAIQAHGDDVLLVFRNEDFSLYALDKDACQGFETAPVIRLPSRLDRGYPLP